MNINAMRARQSRPSVARTYSYILGGRDNYGADKDLGDSFKEDLPGSEQLAITNRAAVIRAVRTVAKAGVRQVIDMGCGLPAEPNVHEVLRQYHPDATIVYLDNDPFVAPHGRALLAVDNNIAMLEADAREPQKIFDEPEVQRLIDFDQPVALLFSAVLSFVEDDEDPAGVVRFWTDRVAPGSYVYISHFRPGETREAAATERKILEAFGGRFRSSADILAFFDGLELLDEGLLPCRQWQPEAGMPTTEEKELTSWEELIVAAIARKA
ncbi:SAM-dependent methyltransferase [Nocardia huaxiensis]|uniref:SAM-dependent methyltransferase n=1 Tax=Nocardia huaxiensis TaxID=2755382 RepID=UPI001E3831BC|nr:SAM-dependent methyltransferase [Nocardia huaxiensis]UFS98080.1 SAM-dependent methyltransferase [Nocardia huaxiensis]